MEILLYAGLIVGLLFFIAVPTLFICSAPPCCNKKKGEEKQILLL